MLRTLIEKLSRGKIIKRRLPSRFGRTPFYVSPDAQLKYLKVGENAFDPELLKIAEEEIDSHSVVWDIGANVGVFSFAAAFRARNGSVLAVEPDLWLAQMIRKSIALKENSILDVQVLPTAISNKNGAATFLIASRGRASNSLESVGGSSQMGGVRERVTVPTLTLDKLMQDFPLPDFVKIDVETAEKLVLEGSKQLMADVKPTFYIEVGSESSQAVTKIFRDNGYVLFDSSSPRSSRIEIAVCAFNTLAIHKDKLGNL